MVQRISIFICNSGYLNILQISSQTQYDTIVEWTPQVQAVIEFFRKCRYWLLYTEAFVGDCKKKKSHRTLFPQKMLRCGRLRSHRQCWRTVSNPWWRSGTGRTTSLDRHPVNMDFLSEESKRIYPPIKNMILRVSLAWQYVKLNNFKLIYTLL